jgi:hypothetical protein
MGCKYDAVKIGTFMRSRISEDWNMCEFTIFVVVPFVNYNLHASTYTHTRFCTLTHPHVHVMSSDGMLYKTNSFFGWRKSCQKYVKGISCENGHCVEVGIFKTKLSCE